MTKRDLILMVQKKHPAYSRQDIARCVDILFASLRRGIKIDKHVEIRGFGVFTVRKRPPKVGRWGKDGSSFCLPERYVLHFKMSQEIKRILNPRF